MELSLKRIVNTKLIKASGSWDSEAFLQLYNAWIFTENRLFVGFFQHFNLPPTCNLLIIIPLNYVNFLNLLRVVLPPSAHSILNSLTSVHHLKYRWLLLKSFVLLMVKYIVYLLLTKISDFSFINRHKIIYRIVLLKVQNFKLIKRINLVKNCNWLYFFTVI